MMPMRSVGAGEVTLCFPAVRLSLSVRASNVNIGILSYIIAGHQNFNILRPE